MALDPIIVASGLAYALGVVTCRLWISAVRLLRRRRSARHGWDNYFHN